MNPRLKKAALAAVSLLLLGALAITVIRWRRDAAEVLGAARSRKVPTTYSELLARYPQVPDQENAAILWQKGIAELRPAFEPGKEMPWDRFELPTPTNAWNSRIAAKAGDLLQVNSTALEFFHRAALLPRSRFPLELRTDATNAHLSGVRSASRLLGLQAHRAMRDEDHLEALKAISAIFSAGFCLAKEPCWVSQLVRARIQRLGYSVVQHGLKIDFFQEPELRQILAKLDAIDPLRALEHLVHHHRVNTVEFLHDPLLDVSLDSLEGRPKSKTKQRIEEFGCRVIAQTLFQRELTCFLRETDPLLTLLRAPDPTPFRSRNQWLAYGEKATSRMFWISSSIGTSLTNGFSGLTQERAEWVLTRAALQIELFRKANHGIAPEKLSDLLPAYMREIPVDPFDGLPLRYSQLGTNGYRIYLIGLNERDDGGSEEWIYEGRRRIRQEDLVFNKVDVSR